MFINFKLPIVQQYIQNNKLKPEFFMTREQIIHFIEKFDCQNYTRQRENYPKNLGSGYKNCYRDRKDRELQFDKYDFLNFNVDPQGRRISPEIMKRKNLIIYIEDYQHQQVLHFLTKNHKEYKPNDNNKLFTFPYVQNHCCNDVTKVLHIRGASIIDAKIKFILDTQVNFTNGNLRQRFLISVKDQRTSTMTMEEFLGEKVVIPECHKCSDKRHYDGHYHDVEVDNVKIFPKVKGLIICESTLTEVSTTVIIEFLNYDPIYLSSYLE